MMTTLGAKLETVPHQSASKKWKGYFGVDLGYFSCSPYPTSSLTKQSYTMLVEETHLPNKNSLMNTFINVPSKATANGAVIKNIPAIGLSNGLCMLYQDINNLCCYSNSFLQGKKLKNKMKPLFHWQLHWWDHTYVVIAFHTGIDSTVLHLEHAQQSTDVEKLQSSMSDVNMHISRRHVQSNFPFSFASTKSTNSSLCNSVSSSSAALAYCLKKYILLETNCLHTSQVLRRGIISSVRH
jgi:hypothetical protein